MAFPFSTPPEMIFEPEDGDVLTPPSTPLLFEFSSKSGSGGGGSSTSVGSRIEKRVPPSTATSRVSYFQSPSSFIATTQTVAFFFGPEIGISKFAYPLDPATLTLPFTHQPS